ncbi:helix-turn-helix domain-containing protein [Paenibacillus solisilvae]|uniref:Helix-turn-helix domain-containing protein n=1 Tax=Paenibacillus solisilvae TaxID=2486751 RepID=A0ABW0VXN5_9BACL
MSDLGALLRKAREQRGYSLDDIQELTKIRKRYLEAIEEGNYKVLPGSFYVRAFVKNYSETVGLDAEEVLHLYQKEIPSAVPEQVVEPIQRPRRAQRQSSDRLSRWGFRMLMWSFLLLIAILVYVYAIAKPGGDNVDSADQTKMTDQTKAPEGTDNSPAQTDNNTNKPVEGSKDTNTVPVTPDPDPVPTVPQTTLTLEKTTGRTDYYQVSPGGTHKIEFKVTGGDCWVGINQTSSKGKILLSKTLKDTETASLDVEGPVYLNMAHANKAEVTIDGVLIEDGNKTGSHKMQLTPAAGTETPNAPVTQTE